MSLFVIAVDFSNGESKVYLEKLICLILIWELRSIYVVNESVEARVYDSDHLLKTCQLIIIITKRTSLVHEGMRRI